MPNHRGKPAWSDARLANRGGALAASRRVPPPRPALTGRSRIRRPPGRDGGLSWCGVLCGLPGPRSRSAMAPKGASKQQSEEDLLLQDFSRNLSAKSSALFFGNAFIVSAIPICECRSEAGRWGTWRGGPGGPCPSGLWLRGRRVPGRGRAAASRGALRNPCAEAGVLGWQLRVRVQTGPSRESAAPTRRSACSSCPAERVLTATAACPRAGRNEGGWPSAPGVSRPPPLKLVVTL